MSKATKLSSLIYYDLRHGQILPMEPPSEPVVMCLGNFDGVHTAHVSLLRQGLALRDQRMPHALCGVFTFLHPSSDYMRTSSQDNESDAQNRPFLRRAAKREHLTTLSEKLRLFSSLGLDFACLCDFSELCGWSPKHFLTFLSNDLSVRGAVCGFNYRFGASGRGTSDTLTAYFDRPDEGFYCHVAPPFCIDGDTVSSTRIRQLLLAGDTEKATSYLGRPYALEAEVVKGKQLGRKLGFPTANQFFPEDRLIPAHGVYAVLCHTPQGILPGVANVGSHPTVDEHAAVNCETHVLYSSLELYGCRMKVEFIDYLRPERHFPSPERLKEAIDNDIIRADFSVWAYLNKMDAPK